MVEPKGIDSQGAKQVLTIGVCQGCFVNDQMIEDVLLYLAW